MMPVPVFAWASGEHVFPFFPQHSHSANRDRRCDNRPNMFVVDGRVAALCSGTTKLDWLPQVYQEYSPVVRSAV